MIAVEKVKTTLNSMKQKDLIKQNNIKLHKITQIKPYRMSLKIKLFKTIRIPHKIRPHQTRHRTKLLQIRLLKTIRIPHKIRPHQTRHIIKLLQIRLFKTIRIPHKIRPHQI
jgi:hypothetical protein